ncbi:MAG: Na/Pi symporter [Firmicutes bacterium]|nr:Na/Pi symporter [Bacillota bacterium]
MYDIITALAGLGVLLYGLRLLNSGLEGSLGFSFRKGLARFSNNRFKAITVGTASTVALQSSTVSITMMTGLVNVGMITLLQATSMVLGANIGSTLSIILISFRSVKVIEILTLFIIIGVAIAIFTKKQKYKKLATVFNAIGILCLGLVLLGKGSSAIAAMPGVPEFLSTLTNPFVLILAGMILTIIIQSLFSSMVIITALAATTIGMTGEPAVSIYSAMFFIIGANIGTALQTYLINVAELSTNGKRLMLLSVAFKVLLALIFGLLMLTPWLNMFYWATTDPTIVLVTANIVMNVITALILLPFVGPIEKLLRLAVRDKKSKSAIFEIFTIEDKMLKIPTIALKQIEKGICVIVEHEVKLLDASLEFLLKDNISDETVKRAAANVEKMIKMTTNNMVQLTNKINDEEKLMINSYLSAVSDADTVLNSCLKIIDLTRSFDASPRALQKSQLSDIKKMGDLVIQTGQKSYEIISEFAAAGKLNDDTKLHAMFDLSEKVSGEKLASKHNLSVCKTNNKDTIDYNTFFSLLNTLGDIKDGFTNIAIKAL